MYIFDYVDISSNEGYIKGKYLLSLGWSIWEQEGNIIWFTSP